MFSEKYLREFNILSYINMSIMVICSLDALKKSSKKKETQTENEIVELLQQAGDRSKKTEK